MSVVAMAAAGWVVDHWAFVEMKTVEPGGDGVDNIKVFKLNTDLFAVISPFKMDSQVNSSTMQTYSGESKKRKKQRKRKLPMNIGEERAEEYHQSIREIVLKAQKELLQAAQCKRYFTPCCETPASSNNQSARRAASIEGPGWSLIEMCHSTQVSPEKDCPIKEIELSNDTIGNILWTNSKSVAVETTIGSNIYLIPSRSRFLMSDITFLTKACSALGIYDLIVIDPPWENKSVKRQKKYVSLDNSQLLDIPLDCLMAPGCLVVVWVTNRHAHRHFLREQFFPHHGIQYLATWTWLKVTRSGEMVYELDSQHKKPYETMMIGQFGKRNNGDHENKEFPDNKVIISVPCSLHSKKPPLQEVMSRFLTEKPRCLELFARNLLHNWTSWGNEVVLHQQRDFYQEVT